MIIKRKSVKFYNEIQKSSNLKTKIKLYLDCLINDLSWVKSLESIIGFRLVLIVKWFSCIKHNKLF